MIVLLKNNKIIGAERSLLELLNINLENLSTKISELELVLSHLNQNEFNIQNYSFKAYEIPIFSLENIKIYDLIETNSSAPVQSPSEELLKIEDYATLDFEEPHISPIQVQEPVMEYTTKTPEEIFIQSANKESENSTKENLIPDIKPVEEQYIEPVSTEEEIQISFEETNEIQSILSLNREETNKLIIEDLQKAAKDLGIDFQTIHNLYLDLLKQINESKTLFEEAIEKKDYEKIHKIAHKLKGAALNLRLSNLALILKEIDEESKNNKPINEIKFLIENFYNFINMLNDSQKLSNVPDNIKNLILITIQNYLDTQNEKKFKKDIKYIEKILNIKINSLEDLQNIIKG